MEEKVSTTQVAMRYGIILALIAIVYYLILSFAGLQANQAMGWIGYIFLVAIVVIAHNDFKKNGDGYMSYGQGLGIGSLIALIAGAINSIFLFIYINFIDDSVLGIMRDAQIEQMERRGMSDEQIEQAMETTSFMSSPVMVAVFAFIGYLFIGFILSLIISAITKKTNPNLEV